MVRPKEIVALFVWVVVVLCLCHKAEPSAIKRWQAHLKKKPFTSTPHISATFRTVPYKSIRKRHNHVHESSYNSLRMRSNNFHLQDPEMAPTYYFAASYPRWRAHSGATVRKFELPDLRTSSPYSAHALRRADAFADIAAPPLIDLNAYNAALPNGIFNADVANKFTGSNLLSSEALVLNDPFMRVIQPPRISMFLTIISISIDEVLMSFFCLTIHSMGIFTEGMHCLLGGQPQ